MIPFLLRAFITFLERSIISLAARTDSFAVSIFLATPSLTAAWPTFAATRG